MTSTHRTGFRSPNGRGSRSCGVSVKNQPLGSSRRSLTNLGEVLERDRTLHLRVAAGVVTQRFAEADQFQLSHRLAVEELLLNRNHPAAEGDANRHRLLGRIGIGVARRREEDVEHSRIVEQVQHVSGRDRAGEPLGVRVEDVEFAVGIVLARIDEAESREVLFEFQELPDALVAVGADAVPDLDVEVLRTRRFLDLRGAALVPIKTARTARAGRVRLMVQLIADKVRLDVIVSRGSAFAKRTQANMPRGRRWPDRTGGMQKRFT